MPKSSPWKRMNSHRRPNDPSPIVHESIIRKATILLHAIPVHTQIAASPFSKESPEQNYRGFLNLALLLLFVNMLRLVMENFMKYGMLLSIPGKLIPWSDVRWTTFILLVLAIGTVIGFGVECLATYGLKSIYVGSLASINVVTLFWFPTVVVWKYLYHPFLGMWLLLVMIVLLAKLISWHVVNSELRDADRQGLFVEAYASMPYPTNVSVGNMAYFLAAPTLCYQPVYPRIDHFRRSFFLKRILEFLSAMAMVYFVAEQYAVPTIQNSLRPFEAMAWGGIIERILKLSISSLYIWLLGFYALFHSLLNASAEALRFGDRSFYQAWWNAQTIDEYWRKWNTPVHAWLKRHIYIPLRARNVPGPIALFVIFTLSALFHEFVVAVPTKVLQGWALLGMLGQVPMILLTNAYLRRQPQSSFGNYFFWVSFCILGQPMCVLLYYRAWIKNI